MPDTFPIGDDPYAGGGLRFRLVHLFYVTALIASAVATFGPSGTIVGLLIIVFWASIFFRDNRPRALALGLLVVLCGACVVMCLMSSDSGMREAGRRAQCVYNLKQIMIAMHNYHDTWKTFPPAYIPDANGKPMHSWRVLLLPYLEQQPLYDQYKFDEPWDGPNNRKLHNANVRSLYCQSQHRLAQTETNYYVVVGPQTAFPGARPVTTSEITDGRHRTIFVVEAQSRGNHWMEPVDITFVEALRQFRSTDFDEAHRSETFLHEYLAGGNVAFGDGSVHFIPNGVSLTTWDKMLSAADGRAISGQEWTQGTTTIKRLKVDVCIALASFVLLTLFPLPWVWLNPHGDPTRPRIDRMTGYRRGN